MQNSLKSRHQTKLLWIKTEREREREGDKERKIKIVKTKKNICMNINKDGLKPYKKKKQKKKKKK